MTLQVTSAFEFTDSSQRWELLQFLTPKASQTLRLVIISAPSWARYTTYTCVQMRTHTFKCAAIVWNMWSNRCDLALTSPRVSLAAVQLMDYALLGDSKLPFQLLSPNRFPRPPNLLCLQEHGFTSEGQPWDPGFLCCSRKSHSPGCLFFQFCLKLDFQFRGKSI